MHLRLSIYLVLEGFGGVIWDRVVFAKSLILLSKMKNLGYHGHQLTINFALDLAGMVEEDLNTHLNNYTGRPGEDSRIC